MTKFIIGVATIFVLGTVSGAFLGARLQEERHQQRDTVENIPENIFEILKHELSLTGEQAAAIGPMLDAAGEEIHGVYERGAAEIEHIVLKYHELIALELTPEQDEIFKAMEAERQRENARDAGDCDEDPVIP